MTALQRLKLRIGQTDNSLDALLEDLLDTAKNAIMLRRFPYAETFPAELEARYAEKQILIALDLFNKMGAEGQITHSENGISRTYESSWISKQLLEDIVPVCGVIT